MSTPISSKRPSTFDLLHWPDNPPSHFPNTESPSLRPPQPAGGGISAILLGAKLTQEEEEALQKRKPTSASKRREMSGSGIFSKEVDFDSCVPERPMFRIHQPAGAVSHILFGEDEPASPKKPTTFPEVAKQRELSGTLQSAEETPPRKFASTSKVKELVGSNIFAPPTDLVLGFLSRNLEGAHQENVATTPSKFVGPNLVAFGQDDHEPSAKKSTAHKVAELSGNGIFKDDAPPSLIPEKCLSAAKVREMSGSDIFADGKPVVRDHYGGIRKPPGGESSLTLV